LLIARLLNIQVLLNSQGSSSPARVVEAQLLRVFHHRGELLVHLIGNMNTTLSNFFVQNGHIFNDTYFCIFMHLLKKGGSIVLNLQAASFKAYQADIYSCKEIIIQGLCSLMEFTDLIPEFGFLQLAFPAQMVARGMSRLF
jgi:hypothetical protein